MPAAATRNLVNAATEKIRASLKDWEEGRLPSPDANDYVIVTDEALRENDPGYRTPEGELQPFEALADEVYEAESGPFSERVDHTLEDTATFIIGRLYGLDIEAARADFAAVREVIAQISDLPAEQREAAVERANNGDPIRLSDEFDAPETTREEAFAAIAEEDANDIDFLANGDLSFYLFQQAERSIRFDLSRGSLRLDGGNPAREAIIAEAGARVRRALLVIVGEAV